jgi:hypothetical protein
MDDRERKPNSPFPAGRFAAALAVSGLISSLPRRGDPAAVTTAVAERFREILPADEFKVEVQDARLQVTAHGFRRGAGSTMSGPGQVSLHLPMPTSLRLRVFFENEARGLQEFVSKVRRRPWPSDSAQPHVLVTDNEVHVWYGSSDESQAELRWRPFSWSELGL